MSRLGDIHLRKREGKKKKRKLKQSLMTSALMNFLALGLHKFAKWLETWRCHWPQESGLYVLITENERSAESLMGSRIVSRCRVTHVYECVCVVRFRWSLWFLRAGCWCHTWTQHCCESYGTLPSHDLEFGRQSTNSIWRFVCRRAINLAFSNSD